MGKKDPCTMEAVVVGVAEGVGEAVEVEEVVIDNREIMSKTPPSQVMDMEIKPLRSKDGGNDASIFKDGGNRTSDHDTYTSGNGHLTPSTFRCPTLGPLQGMGGLMTRSRTKMQEVLTQLIHEFKSMKK